MIGWCTRGHHREAVVDQAEDAVGQALVVVDDVEVAAPVAQQLADAHAEGERLGEAGRAHERELGHVDAASGTRGGWGTRNGLSGR